MQSDHIFYYRSKLIFQYIFQIYKIACCFKLKQIEKSFSLVIALKNYSNLFLTKKVLKKGIAGMGVWA